MFKHEITEGDDENSDDDCSEDEVEEIDTEEAIENSKPSLEMVQKAIEKVDLLFKKVSQNFKCQHCDFEEEK